MFLSKVASEFLTLFNERNNTNHTPFSFFEQELFPVVLDAEKPLNFVINSPFHANAIKASERKNKSFRLGLLKYFHNKVNRGINDGSVLFGNSASEDNIYRPYSGLVPDVPIKEGAYDVYLSWIAQCLSCGVTGGWLFLFDNAELNLWIFSGWKAYRTLVDTDQVADKSINTWNSMFIDRCVFDEYHELFDTELPMRKNGKLIPPTFPVMCSAVSWALSQEDTVNSLVYLVSKQNKTIGVIPVDLQMFRRRLSGVNLDILNSRVSEIGPNGKIDLNLLLPKVRYVKKKNVSDYINLIKSVFMTSAAPSSTITYAKEVATWIRSYNDKERKEAHTKLVQRMIGQSNKNVFLKWLNDITAEDKGAKTKTVNDAAKLMEYIDPLTQSDFVGFSSMIAIYYRQLTVNKK